MLLLTSTLTSIGSYGMGMSSSGDAYSIQGSGTYGAVNKPGVSDDVIVSVDPATGTVMSEVGNVTGYSDVYGLAGWLGSIFAFDASGDVILIDPVSGSATVIKTTNHSWWGAGVGTVVPT